jgi:MFS family permease
MNRVVLALSAARLGDAVGNSILFVVIPLYLARLPAPWLPFAETIRAGLLISAFGIAAAAVQPFAGYFSDRADRRKPFVLGGLLLMAASTAGFLFARQEMDLLALRVSQGIGMAVTLPAAMAILAGGTQTSTRGGSMGVYAASRMLGLAIGPLLGGALLDSVGFSSAFYAATAMILLAAVLVYFWIHDTPSGMQAEPGGEPPEPVRFFDRSIFTPQALGSGLATFCLASSFSLLTPLEAEFNQRLDQGAFLFGVAFSAMVISRLLLQYPMGRWSDRIGRKPLIIGGLLLMAPATGLLGEVQATWQLIGLRIVQGIAASAIVAPAFALAADASRAGRQGRQMSLTTTGFAVGIATGPLVAGILAVPWFELPFIVMAVVVLVSAFAIYHYVPETVIRVEADADYSR